MLRFVNEWDEAAVGEKPRSTHAGSRERDDATPTRNASVLLRPRAYTLGGSALGAGTCRRSLDDTRDGATRHLTRSLPELSEPSHAIDRLGAGSRVPRAAFVRPSRQEGSETRCHEGGAPFHVSCETTTRVGVRASSRMRAARVSCSTPCSAGSPYPLTCGEGSRRRDYDRPPRRESDRTPARCCHHTDDAPVGSQRVEGCCDRDERVQQGEPRLDLSRTPLVAHRMRTPSEHDVRRWSRLVSPSPKQVEERDRADGP